ncbi:prolyl oligopeptidase family serine peptidase [Aquimarina muelleri]|nr:prolyl oligopeptidase family serine peptidase [Aquimarina muelleri]MCX2764524.1 prolyl oligopeptidase family serine peptidase [Aquimarina muelleri]
MNWKSLVIILYITLSGCQGKINELPSKIITEECHGITIKDPYRYAEDTNSSIVKNWIADQNKVSKNLLNKIEKRQYLIDKQISYDKKKTFIISKLKVTENNKHFYLKRLPEENIPKLYYRNSFSSPEKLLYDAKQFKTKTQHTYIINYIQPNWDGTKIVISLTYNGKEISELIILDVSSKKTHPEVLTNAWPSSSGGIKWLPNNSEFIYSYYPIIDPKSKKFLKNTKAVLHNINKPSSGFIEILSKEHNPDLDIEEEDFPIISIENSKSKYLIGKIAGGGGLNYHNSYYLDINDITTKKWMPLFKKSNQIKDFIIKEDSIIYKTSKKAPNFKICITSIKNSNFENPKVLIQEYKNKVITDFDITNEALYFVTNTNGVKAKLYKYTDNITEEIKLDTSYGSITLNVKSSNHSELWVSAQGWTTNNKRYEYKNGILKNKHLNNSLENEIPNDIVVEEIEIDGHDGEKIPLSLIYNKSIKRNGQNMVMMDSYGSFGISMQPSFSLRRLLWVMEGGIYAIAHVRGGGEKGDTWHKGGYKATKPNTWKDFISCTEFLIKNKYTSSKKTAIWSGSAGGILIGRAITDRPDLFTVAIVEFGSLNILRSIIHANGDNIAKEFGSVKDSIEFKYLLEMDAYQHIKDKEEYPATLLTAGLNDPRVPVWNTIKFGARLQKANTSNKPNFLLIDSESGHAKDDPKLKEFERYANILSFALWQTGHRDYQPK